MILLLLHGFHSLQVQWRHSLDSLVSVTMTLNTEEATSNQVLQAPSWASSRGSMAYSLVEVVHWEYSVHRLTCLSALLSCWPLLVTWGSEAYSACRKHVLSPSPFHLYCMCTTVHGPTYTRIPVCWPIPYTLYVYHYFISLTHCNARWLLPFINCAVWRAYREQWLWLRCTWWLCPAWSTGKHSRWSNTAGLLLRPTRDSQASWLTLKSKSCLRCVPPGCRVVRTVPPSVCMRCTASLSAMHGWHMLDLMVLYVVEEHLCFSSLHTGW